MTTDPFNWRTEIIRVMPPLRAFARSLAKNLAHADDLVQDTLTKAWAKRQQFEPGTNLQAWLFTILRNTFYTNVRRRRWEVEDVDDLQAAKLTVGPRQEWSLALRALERAIQRLPPEQREVLILIVGAGVTYDEAARICDCAVGTIKSRLARARARLAGLMEMESVTDLGAISPMAAAE
ncbi:sigma-70 family RNA polymerase sigma factor [Oleomonas cavernae]|uniref:Sigma-70 family RNA polymerase sigma factor n=1 Tax=Oleomonas cavernae TaxID=2320859 RepID=A0A418WE81_9PROT|nr:sigma-70 family RNA polymerase sigma factor [Oleomonas cavernae]RJF88337.1 sigma-70 family RNA polymerase sigma factor [Oleomonas cavernae]